MLLPKDIIIDIGSNDATTLNFLKKNLENIFDPQQKNF